MRVDAPFPLVDEGGFWYSFYLFFFDLRNISLSSIFNFFF